MAARTDEYGHTWITIEIASGNPQVTAELTQTELVQRIVMALGWDTETRLAFAEELLDGLDLPGLLTGPAAGEAGRSTPA